MGKITETRKLYKETIKELTKTEENWISFLDSSSWNFKYDFADQILIYAQRPDATACADIATWNNRVKRWINKNANGIFIFDNTENSQFPFKLVFDVSDTHNYKGTPYKLWIVEERYEKDIIENLDAVFGAESDDKDLATSITLNSYNMVVDNIQDYISSIRKYVTGTKFEGYSDSDIYNIFVPSVWASVSYMMMTRCGIDARKNIDINEFMFIKEFNNTDLITILGQAVSDIAELGLREIAKTIKNLQIEEKNQNRTFVNNQKKDYDNVIEKNIGGNDYGENKLHENGRLQHTESSNGERNTSRWQIRKNEVTLSKNREESRIYDIIDERGTSKTLNTDTRTSDSNDKSDSTKISNEEWDKRRNENERPNEMGRLDEQLQDDSRGTSITGIDLQLGEWNPLNDRETAIFDDDYSIVNIINNAPKIISNKEKMSEFFNKNLKLDNNTVNFLVEIFGKEYNEFVVNDKRVGYKLYNNGIYLWKGNYLNRTEKCFLKWEDLNDYCISYAQMNTINDTFYIPTENEQKENIADVENTPAFFVSQEIIDNDLQSGSGFQDGKFRIFEQFSKGENTTKNADFLKNEYGIGGHNISDTNITQNHDSKGIRFEEFKTNKKYLLKWTQVAKRIEELISADRYLSEQEKDEYNDWLDSKGVFHNPIEDIINDADYKLAERLNNFAKDYDFYAYMDNIVGESEIDNIGLIRADIEDEVNIKTYIDFFKTAVDEMDQDDEMLQEAEYILNELENRLPYYEFHNGDIVYIGIDEYEIRSINDNVVELADTKFPLFTKEMDRKEFDKKIKENPANDKLRTGKRIDDIEQQEKAEEKTLSLEEKLYKFLNEYDIYDVDEITVFEVNEIINNSEKLKDTIEYLQEIANVEDNNDENIINEETLLKPKVEKKRRNRIEYFDLHPEIPLEERNNYHIENKDLGVGTPKQKFKRNIEAIKILKQCNEENRYATPEEQQILSEYVGWGGIPEVFDSNNDSWREEYNELKQILTEKEYNEARESTLTAFYTPPIVISSIYNALEKMGLERGNILEPSCRSG